MAWVATDDFNGYSDGDLNTLNGGSGWGGAWTQSAGTISVQGSVVYEGAKALSSPSGSAQLYSRALTSTITDGLVSFRLRMTATTIDGSIVLENGSGNGRMYFRIAPDGNFKIFDNGGGVYQTIQAYSINTWYLCEIEFDDTAQPDKYRARVDGGSWTSWYTVNSGSYTSISHLRIDRDNNVGVLYVDDIKPSSTVQNLTLTAETGSYTLTGNDVGLGRLITMVASVGSYILTGIDVVLRKSGWENQSKNSSTFTNQTKNASSFTNISKNSSTWTNQTK